MNIPSSSPHLLTILFRKRRILSISMCILGFLILQANDAFGANNNNKEYAQPQQHNADAAVRRLSGKPWYVRHIRVGSYLTLPISYVTLVLIVFSTAWVLSYFNGGDNKKNDAYVVASHILVTDLTQTGKDTLVTLKQEIGNDYHIFSQKAAKVSTCPSRKQGGNLGRFPPGVMAPTFDRMCFDPASPIQTTLGPIQSPFGYHLIYIHERKLP